MPLEFELIVAWADALAQRSKLLGCPPAVTGSCSSLSLPPDLEDLLLDGPDLLLDGPDLLLVGEDLLLDGPDLLLPDLLLDGPDLLLDGLELL